MSDDKKSVKGADANLDPISGETGAHPVGTGIGAASAGAAGAAIGGAVGGPVGAVVGAVVGAFSGGLAGKGVAEAIDPTVEDAYWRDNYNSRPYADAGVPTTTISLHTARAMKDTAAITVLVRVSTRLKAICSATTKSIAASRM